MSYIINRMKESIKVSTIFSVLIIMLLAGGYYLKETHVNPKEKAEIVKQIECISGEPVSIERSSVFKSTPFTHTRYARTYKFTYMKDDKQITGWACFDLVDQWIMNEDEKEQKWLRHALS